MGRYQGSFWPFQPLWPLHLGTEEAQTAWGFGERGIALSILLADLVLTVITLNLPASHGSKLLNLLGKPA